MKDFFLERSFIILISILCEIYKKQKLFAHKKKLITIYKKKFVYFSAFFF